MNSAVFSPGRSFRTLRVCFSFLLVLGLFAYYSSGVAEAQPRLDRSFETQNYDPAIGPNQFITVESTSMPGNYNYGVALDYTFQYRPLSIFLVEDDDLQTENVVMDWQSTLFVHGFFGIETKGLFGNYLFKQLQFGLSLPVYIQSGELDVSDYPMPGSTPSEIRGFGLGDLRIHLKTSLWRFLNQKLRLAFSTTVTLPWVGDIPNYRAENNFAGEENVTIRPRLIAEFVHRDLRVAANVGFIARFEESEFFSTTVGQQFLYGAAGEYAFYEGTGKNGLKLAGLLEVNGRNGLSIDLDENPLELGAGIRMSFPWGLSFLAGGGAGLIKAVGSPVWRAFLRVQFAPGQGKDTDGDGVPDYQDKCPNKPGPTKYHGCPRELVDSDGDGIPDYKDKCPNGAEDMDGFQDEDGCPDPDNDGDGVCDPNDAIQNNLAKFKGVCTGKDNCPMDKGPAKHSGCPKEMLDSDGDGVPDYKDKCPEDPEDIDGFEDKDGCPDPDNDGDGICDPNEVIQRNLDKYKNICKGKDKCPKDPEDKDGYRDEDGCPDPDNDGDGICDDNAVIQKNVDKFSHVCTGKDKCSDKPGTIDGVDDLSGCPTKGKPDVKVTKDKLILRRNIQFKRTSDKMVEPSETILNQIALHLRWKLDTFKNLVIVGFVEPKMRESKAKEVSQAWADAVKAYLVKKGIPADKIIARGLGGARPIYEGRSRTKHRRINRRVEFFLVK